MYRPDLFSNFGMHRFYTLGMAIRLHRLEDLLPELIDGVERASASPISQGGMAAAIAAGGITTSRMALKIKNKSAAVSSSSHSRKAGTIAWGKNFQRADSGCPT